MGTEAGSSTSVGAYARFAVVSALGAALFACASIQVTPELSPVQVDFRIPGRVAFEGGASYLPRVLAGLDAGSPEGEERTRISYEYDVRYTGTEEGLLQLFNPLVVLGFPTGSEGVIAEGELVIEAEGEPAKIYTASCLIKRTRGIYWGGNLSSSRHEALIAVRDSIDRQVVRDRAELAATFGSGIGDAAPQEEPEP